MNKKVLISILISLGIIALVSLCVYRYMPSLVRSFKQPTIDLKALADKKNIVPVAIIGSGPAGLSAALYTSRANMHTVVFEGRQPGGQLTTTTEVENWPAVKKNKGPAIMQGLKEQAQAFNALFSQTTIERVDFSTWPFKLWTDEGTEIYALSVIISTGATSKLLNVPGEKTYWAQGVSVCAICDAAFYKDKDVVVVGGGDSAIEEALQLASNAKHITILVRTSQMRASKVMQDRLKNYPHISIRYETSITEIKGDDHHVTSIDILSKGVKENMPIDGVFLAVGHEPNTKLFTSSLELDKNKHILVGPYTQSTSCIGVFAAGDVSDPRYRQAGVASGDGIKAGLDTLNFLEAHGFTDIQASHYERSFFDPQAGDSIEISQISSEADFEQRVIASKKPVVVDFFTPVCPSCMQMMPTVASVAGKFKDTVTFVKVDGAKLPGLMKRFFVSSVPCFLVFYEGMLAGRTTAVMTKRELQEFVQKFIA